MSGCKSQTPTQLLVQNAAHDTDAKATLQSALPCLTMQGRCTTLPSQAFVDESLPDPNDDRSFLRAVPGQCLLLFERPLFTGQTNVLLQNLYLRLDHSAEDGFVTLLSKLYMLDSTVQADTDCMFMDQAYLHSALPLP